MNRVIKLVVIGNSASGKSCMLMRFADNTFEPAFSSTLGIDFKIRTITLSDGITVVKLQIWDTAGQERYQSITTAYYRNAGGIIIVYDTTDVSSYQTLGKWFDAVEPFDIPVIALVGTKKDMIDARQVDYNSGRALAQSRDIDLFFECSAKTKEGIDEIFITMAERIIGMEAPIELEEIIVPQEDITTRRKNCC